MPIDLTHEKAGPFRSIALPESPFGDIERCHFCGTPTRFWAERHNVPVCPACAPSRRASELPDRGQNVRRLLHESAQAHPPATVVRHRLDGAERGVIAPRRWPEQDRTELAYDCWNGWRAWVSAARGLNSPPSLYLTEARSRGIREWLGMHLERNPEGLDERALEILGGLNRWLIDWEGGQ